MMKISVFGLGYVGAVTSACFARTGHSVIGVDINGDKVDMIEKGRSPIVEAQLEEIIREQRSTGRLQAITDANEAILKTDVSLICVGTPGAKNGSLDYTNLENVCADIGRALRGKNVHHIIVVRSTALPGTTSGRIIPLLEKTSGKKHGEAFSVVYNPEFLREGASVKDFYNPPFTLIGTNEAAAAKKISCLYQEIVGDIITTKLEVAEMIKYASNAFHALKIAFANEIGTLCKASGIDSNRLMDIFLQDQKLNISGAYLRPGFAFGGSCLPKDLRALLYHAKNQDLDLPLLESILPSNNLHLKRALELILSSGKQRIGIVGLAFKEGTDDLRESPTVQLTETLLGKGFKLMIYDEHVSLARLTGSNKKYIEKEIPHIECLLCQGFPELLQHSEVLVVANRTGELETLQTKKELLVIDLIGLPHHFIEGLVNYKGLAW